MTDPRNIFVNQREQSTTSQPNDNVNYQDMSVEDKKKMLTELANKYQKEGEGQLVKDILANVIEQKAKGTLSNQQLQQFANRIMPLLNGDQKERLQSLLDQLLQL